MANGRPGRPKGLPKTGGRKKGVGDKSTAALVALCQTYTVEAVDTLRAIMTDPEAKDAARVAAANIILERGHGKVAMAPEDADKFSGLAQAIMEARVRARPQE